MKAKTLLAITLTLLVHFSFAQKEWSNWYFSGNNLLTFRNNNIPQMQRDFINPVPTYWWSYYYNGNRGSAYSDPVTGEMRFLLAGRFAYDKNYDIIEKSLELRACPGDEYSFHIIPFPGNPDKFYVIQHQDVHADILAAQTGLQVRCPNAIGLGYSILDLSLNNGLGDFTSMNNVLKSGVSAGIVLIRHANGKDVWVIVHGWGDNNYYAYLFSDNGVSAPVVTAIGPSPTAISPAVNGNIISSHDGKTIASQIAENPFIELYDFDNNTGRLSNHKRLQIPGPAANNLIFSPDDSKLYFLGAYWTPGVYQFDFNAANVEQSLTKIAEDRYTSMYDMQLGLDGKIYIAGAYDNNEYYLPIIACPNLPKYACNYKEKGLLTPNSYGQFPNLINDFIKQPKAPKVIEFSLGNDTAICFGTFKISAPEGWQNYRWNTGETTKEITVSKPGLYYVLAGDEGFSCPTAFGYIKISNASRPLDLGKDTLLCGGNSYTIKTPANFSNFLWNDNTTTPEKTVTTGGLYSLKAFDENGCTNWDTISVSFKYYPRATFGNDTTLCNNQTLKLRLEPPNFGFGNPPQYLWQDGSIKDTLTVKTPGTYWGKVIYDGCTISDTITVRYIDIGSISLGTDTTLCVGDSLLIGSSLPGAKYLWSTGETTSHLRVRSTGTYWVKINTDQCSLADTISVNFQSKPLTYLGNDTALCEKQTIVLQTGVPNASYLWQDESSKQFFTVSKEGLYWAETNLNGCVARDSIVVSYKSLPVLNLGKDTGMCEQKAIWLKSLHPSIKSYLWQDGSADADYQITKAGEYILTVIGLNDCINSDTINVVTSSLPNFNLGSDTILCQNQSLALNLSLSNASYQWNTGNTTRSLLVIQPGLYWVEVIQNGCSKRDSINIFHKPIPTVQLGKDTILCEGSSKLLDATNAGATYKWQDNSTNSTLSVTKPGLYYATVTINGCENKDTIQISYRNKPKFTLGTDTTICTGQLLTLKPDLTNVNYLWQDGSTKSTFIVKDIGRYSLTATNDCGTFTDDITITKGICKLYVPNAFTPDNNGLNDVFRVKDPDFIQTFKMVIYSRWGEVLFSTTDPYKGWDGKYKGIDQPSGNYIWQINLLTKEGESDSAYGSVVLIR